MFSDGGLTRPVKNLDKAPFSTLRGHWFLRGKIPTECPWDRMDFGQWNKLPPDSGWNFPFPEAKASTPQAGNNSPLARAKNLSGSAFFHPGGAGRSQKGPSLPCGRSVANLQQGANSFPAPSREHFVQRFPRWEQLGQGWPEVFLPDHDPDSAPRARQKGGVGSGCLALPGAGTNLGPVLLLKMHCLTALRRERRKKKMLSLVKRVFPLCLRPCWGDAGKPEQKPSCTARAETCSEAHWLPTNFQRVFLQFSLFGPIWGQTSQRDNFAPSIPMPTWQWQVGLWICSGTWESCLSPLPVGTCCGCRGGGRGGPNLRWPWETLPDRWCLMCSRASFWKLSMHTHKWMRFNKSPYHSSERWTVLTSLSAYLLISTFFPAGQVCHLLIPSCIASHWTVRFLYSQHVFFSPLLLVLIMSDCILPNFYPWYLLHANICRFITFPLSHHFTKVYLYFSSWISSSRPPIFCCSFL